MRLLAALLVVVVVVHHGNAEASGDDSEVVSLEDSEIGLSQNQHMSLRVRVRSTSPQPAGPGTIPKGSGSGSGSGSAAAPKVLKKPYHLHMEHNKPLWIKKGGWTPAKESMITMAKAALARAETYEKKKRTERKIAEMGCPCHGDKYYNYVWDPNKNVASLKVRPTSAVKGAGSGSGKSQPAGCNPSDPKSPCDADPRYGIKAMLKKYGKLGPNSSWTQRHEKKKIQAKAALKIAEKDAHAAFMLALPTFKKMKQEMPEFFTNGECKCPSWWTPVDAAKLSAMMAKEKEDDLYKHKRMMWARKKLNSGEAAREAAAEEARMRAAAAAKAKPTAPPPKPAGKPVATPAGKPAAAKPAAAKPAAKPAETVEQLFENEIELDMEMNTSDELGDVHSR